MGDETRKAIGLFWDIENCNVPRYVSALSVVQRLRERFFRGLREAEFMCVCDINKESKHVIEELNNGQVGIVFVEFECCLLYTSPSPRDHAGSRMPSSA